MRVLSCLTTEHNLLLVTLAALICTLGAWTSLNLLGKARGGHGGTAKAWVFFGAVAAGSSVWCTHFVAMLAFEPQTPVSYEAGLTALSLILVIFTSTIAFLVASMNVPFAASLGGAAFGGGVAVMHYVGMAAFSVDATILWNSGYFTASSPGRSWSRRWHSKALRPPTRHGRATGHPAFSWAPSSASISPEWQP